MNLTRRQHQVFDKLAQGRLYKEAADELGVSINTVRTHIRQLYKALGIHDRKAINNINRWREI